MSFPLVAMQSTPGSTTLPDGDGTYQCSNDAERDGDDALSGCRVDWRSHHCQQPWRFTQVRNKSQSLMAQNLLVAIKTTFSYRSFAYRTIVAEVTP